MGLQNSLVIFKVGVFLDDRSADLTLSDFCSALHFVLFDGEN